LAICTFGLLVAIWPAAVSALDTDISAAIGLEFLSDGPAVSRTEAKEKLRSIIMKRLPQLQNWPGDYATLKPKKAIAIRYDSPNPNPFVPYWYRLEYLEPHIGYWGGAWEYDSLEAARSAALRSCGEKCILFLEDDAVVIPDSTIDEFIAARQALAKKELVRLSQSERINLLGRAR